MTWFRPYVDNHSSGPAYYTALDPADFYEWKISGTIPKGSRFSKSLPPSDVFTKGFIVATANLPDDCVKQDKKDQAMFEVIKDANIEIEYHVGAAPTANELLDKYHEMKKKFARDTDHFRRTVLSQTFVVNPGDQKVYRITEKDGAAVVDEYDTFVEIERQLIEARRALTVQSQDRKYRAYELEPLRRFENVFVMLNNKNTIIDPAKVAQIFTIAKIEPLRTKKISWTEYYTTISPEAKNQHERIQTLDSMKWIKEAEQVA